MRLDATTTLPDGTRVRIRLPHASDRAAVAELLDVPHDDLAVTRVLRFDPRRRAAACATVFCGGVEELVAYGSIDLADDEPDVLVARVDAPPEADAALAAALRAHAARWRRAA
jgi:hypothetical protein